MRRLICSVAALALLCVAACNRQSAAIPDPAPAKDDGQLLSVVNMSNPRGTVQLVRGFYNLEADSWRWTAGKFAASLRPPAGSAQSGARLELKFAIPDAVFSKTGAISLSASVNGQALPPQTFSAPGESVYVRDIPAASLTGDAVVVDFATDKSLPPGAQDKRELALIVKSVGLLPLASQ